MPHADPIARAEYAKAYQREYYRNPENVERRKLFAKRYRAENLEELRAYDRQRGKNPERVFAARLSHRRNYTREKQAKWDSKKPLWLIKFSSGLSRAGFIGAVIVDRDALREFYRQVFSKPDGICVYCLKVIPIQKITIDHAVPYALGGVHAVHNLAVSCKSCNDHKHITPPDKWLERLRGAN